MSRVSCPHQHIIGHFGDESFQSINCSGTGNLITLCPRKSNHLDNVQYANRNVKSECILIKLCALVFEYICERITKSHEKILFHSGVINIQIPMTKYLGFQHSVAYCRHLSLAQRARVPRGAQSVGERSESRGEGRADLEVTGVAEIVDPVGVVVAEAAVLDEPVDVRRRMSAGTTRDVTNCSGPGVLDAAVIGSEPRRNCTATTPASHTLRKFSFTSTK